MSNTILGGILLIVLAAASFVVYNNFWRPAEEAKGPVTAVSFICDTESHFVAEFDENFENVAILENGQTVRTLPRVPDVAVRFADSNYAYVFAGEEASVTDLVRGMTVSCRQPFDPNNAPYNFGDAGEGDGTKPDVTTAVGGNIAGTWKSVDDGKFEREFQAGGTVFDRYEGEEPVAGTWEVFTSETASDTAMFPLEAGAAYIKLDFGDEVLQYKIGKATPEELELIYLGRGNVLRFTKVQ